MKPDYSSNGIDLYLGDCLDILPKISDKSIFTAVVTDPPYGLEFMGKEWDHGIPGSKFWRTILALSLPGAPLLAFGGTRTHHRLWCAIEDAGWVLKDTVMWVYGSGFPKSLDISKAIDEQPKAINRLQEFSRLLKECREALGMSISSADLRVTGGSTMYSFLEGRKVGEVLKIYPPNKQYYDAICKLYEIDGWDDIVENNLEVVGSESGNFGYQKNGERWIESRKITVPTTDTAKLWEGYGTALKPAWEPICVAMKPVDGNYAENATKHGVAGLNIDECRVGTKTDVPSVHATRASDYPQTYKQDGPGWGESRGGRVGSRIDWEPQSGRFPGNLIHDGSSEVEKLFPKVKSGGGDKHGRKPSTFYASTDWEQFKGTSIGDDSGSAARFFYCAKASKAERDAGCEDLDARFAPTMGEGIGGKEHDPETATRKHNTHPTVKPIALMKYLCKLVKMPEKNLVLDPFLGSGSTAIACLAVGQSCVGIEKDQESFDIAVRRVKHAIKEQNRIKEIMEKY